MILSGRSFLPTAACPGQYIHRSLRRWLSTTATYQKIPDCLSADHLQPIRTLQIIMHAKSPETTTQILMAVIFSNTLDRAGEEKKREEEEEEEMKEEEEDKPPPRPQNKEITKPNNNKNNNSSNNSNNNKKQKETTTADGREWMR